MTTYDIYHKKIHKDLTCWSYIFCNIWRFFNKILWFCPKISLWCPMGQSANMAHFVAFFICFQNIVTLKLLFGANRVYSCFKNVLFTGNSLTGFRQKSAVFAPKWPIEHTNRVWDIRNDYMWHLTWDNSQGF
jgi:hypothetical protein